MCRQSSNIFAPRAEQRKAEKFRVRLASSLNEIAAIAAAAGRRLVIWTVVLRGIAGTFDLEFVPY